MPLEIKQNARTKQWHARIVAPNGRILCHSEQYTRRRNAVAALESMIAETAKAYNHGRFDKPTGFDYTVIKPGQLPEVVSVKLTDF